MSDFSSMDEHISTEIQSQPNSREAEEAVLGSVFIYPESYYEIAQVIQADDFYVIRNQWIWESFTRLHDRRAPIDLLTVSEDLEERNQLTEIGGTILPGFFTQPDAERTACRSLCENR
jgi:replicative DNA helicase